MCCGCCGADNTKWNKGRGPLGIIAGMILMALGLVAVISPIGCDQEAVPKYKNDLQGKAECVAACCETILNCQGECHEIEKWASVVLFLCGLVLFSASAFTTLKSMNDPEGGMPWKGEIAIFVAAILGGVFAFIIAIVGYALYWLPVAMAVVYAVVSCGYMDSSKTKDSS